MLLGNFIRIEAVFRHYSPNMTVIYDKLCKFCILLDSKSRKTLEFLDCNTLNIKKWVFYVDL